MFYSNNGWSLGRENTLGYRCKALQANSDKDFRQ